MNAESVDIPVGETLMRGTDFRFFAGKQWYGFEVPEGFALSTSHRDGTNYIVLSSPTDTRTNIIISQSQAVQSLPSSAELVAQMSASASDVSARGDIGNLGEHTAVAAQGKLSSGYVGIIVLTELDGSVWTFTVNAPDAEAASVLVDAAQNLARVDDSVDGEVGVLAYTADAKTFTVKAGGSRLSVAMPEGYVITEGDGGVVGFAKENEPGSNVTFVVDPSGFTTQPNELLRALAAVLDQSTVADMRTVAGVTAVAGYPAAAVDVTFTTGDVTRLYVVDLDGTTIQIAVNEPSKTAAQLERRAKVIDEATR